MAQGRWLAGKPPMLLQMSEAEMARMQGRLDATEQRQQQMMAMLAKAIHNPIFLQQLLNGNRPPVHRLDSGEATNGGNVAGYLPFSRIGVLAG